MTMTEQGPRPAPAAGGTSAGRGVRGLLAALAGLLAAMLALGVAELVAAAVGPASSPVVAVGDAAITLTPEPVKTFAIRTFGENDKIALVVGTLVVIALYALLLGLVALSNRLLGVAGIALFGLVGIVAAVTRPAGGLISGLPALLGAAAGALALLALLAPLQRPVAAAAPVALPGTTG
ncbi:MAG TPA: hypothetical protein VD834_01935, partial [Blastococcus sp.]|nr:hypothetical protein [Blastococcus sp.]